MVDLSKYWKLVRLSAAGDIITEAVLGAQDFLKQHFPEPTELSDSLIQQQLMERYHADQQAGNIREQNWAEICLRCFISGQIQQACIRIEVQFGNHHGFTRHDLLVLVLDEMPLQHSPRGQGSSNPRLTYSDTNNGATNRTLVENTFCHRILHTFNPNRGSLTTWTIRMVQSHPELDRFLLERGVYQVSDWAILNSYTPKRLHRILGEIDRLPDWEIQQSYALLESYHTVYRGDRQLQFQSGVSSKRCHPPTEEQLQRIAQVLQSQIGINLSPKVILARLLRLADRLRQHSIWARGGPPPSTSFDLVEVQNQVDRAHSQSYAEPDEQIEFLQQYQQQLSQSLVQALDRVLQAWSTKLRPKNTAFLTALRLFYCCGMAMGEIAPLIGLEAQYQVTRLLKLKAFRADVRHHLLEQLRHSVFHLAQEYAHPDRLQHLDQEIDTLLGAEVEKVVTGCPIQSVFAKRLCQQLEETSNQGVLHSSQSAASQGQKLQQSQIYHHSN